jgi:hypothetical protein
MQFRADAVDLFLQHFNEVAGEIRHFPGCEGFTYYKILTIAIFFYVQPMARCCRFGTLSEFRLISYDLEICSHAF